MQVILLLMQQVIFRLTNSNITSVTNGQGNAGDITITARELFFSNATISAGIREESITDFFWH